MTSSSSRQPTKVFALLSPIQPNLPFEDHPFLLARVTIGLIQTSNSYKSLLLLLQFLTHSSAAKASYSPHSILKFLHWNHFGGLDLFDDHLRNPIANPAYTLTYLT